MSAAYEEIEHLAMVPKSARRPFQSFAEYLARLFFDGGRRRGARAHVEGHTLAEEGMLRFVIVVDGSKALAHAEVGHHP